MHEIIYIVVVTVVLLGGVVGYLIYGQDDSTD